MALLETVRRSLWTMKQFGASRATPGAVLAAQQKRLRRLLRHAAERSPFYRDRFRGLDLDRCPLSDLPTTSKAELMAHFDEVVTDPQVKRADLERFVDDPDNVGRLFQGRYPVCHTSGSQGQPMLIVQNQLTLDLLFGFHLTRGNVRYRFGPLEALRRVFSPGRIAVLISRPGFFPSAWVWQHLPAALRPYVRLLFAQANDPNLMDRLREFSPTALTSTPTTLDLLAVRPDRPRFPHLQQVVAWSETLTDAARARMKAAFGVPVMNNYACGECLFLTNGCPTDPGAHVNADWAILEVVDENNRPVPPGVLGHKGLLTNLANDVQPLIRYEVGDRLQMAEGPCRCLNRLPRVERVLGRAADFFWVRVGESHRPLTAYPFQHAFDHLREVREWQATQQERNRVLVRFEPLPGATVDLGQARRRLEERLALAGLGGVVEVAFEVVPRLAIDAGTGKFKRMVSLVGAPEEVGRPGPAMSGARPG